MLIIKNDGKFLLIAFLLCSCTVHQTLTKSNSGVNYEIMLSDSLQSIVLLKDSVNKTIDTLKLEIIADSVVENRPASNSPDCYRVWFYFRRDWKGQGWYAAKSYAYDYGSRGLKAESLMVSGITGNEKQDEINANSYNAVHNPPIKSTFDTLTYLTKINGFSKRKIQQIIKIQLDNNGEVKSFIEWCKTKLDSAEIKIDGKANYTHIYYNHFIKVWGNASYPLVGNGITVSQIVTFEGAYDIFGNALYFKSSLDKVSR